MFQNQASSEPSFDGYNLISLNKQKTARWCNLIEFITIDNIKIKRGGNCSSLVLLFSDLMRWKGTVGKVGDLAVFFSSCWKLNLEAHCGQLALLVSWQQERLEGGAGRAAAG